MKEWIINHKDSCQILAAVFGAVVCLTAVVVLCGIDNSDQTIELVSAE